MKIYLDVCCLNRPLDTNSDAAVGQIERKRGKSVKLAPGDIKMINVSHMTPVEIQQAGLEVLAQELGPVGFIRFMQQYQLGKGDYTADRHRWLDRLAVDDVLALLQDEQDGRYELDEA